MTEQRILEKLDNLEKQSSKLENKVDKIETAISLIAVQSEKLSTMQEHVHMLQRRYDEVCGPAGTLTRIRQFQASCPRNQIEGSINRQWLCISLLATTVVGIALKAFGVV